MSKKIEECNWLQALEGGIDTSHAPILHRAISTTTSRAGIDPRSPFVRGSAPVLEVDLTEYGYRYVGVRKLPEGGSFAIDTSYYTLRAIERIVPEGAAWRDLMLPLMYPEGVKEPVPVIAR